MMGKRGPEPTVNAEKADEIIGNVSGGLSVERSCQCAGVTKFSFYRYLRKNPHLRTSLKKADACFEQAHIDIIREQAHKTWTAAAWILERKYPDRWARRDRTDVTSGGRPISSMIVTLPEKHGEGPAK